MQRPSGHLLAQKVAESSLLRPPNQMFLQRWCRSSIAMSTLLAACCTFCRIDCQISRIIFNRLSCSNKTSGMVPQQCGPHEGEQRQSFADLSCFAKPFTRLLAIAARRRNIMSITSTMNLLLTCDRDTRLRVGLSQRSKCQKHCTHWFIT